MALDPSKFALAHTSAGTVLRCHRCGGREVGRWAPSLADPQGSYAPSAEAVDESAEQHDASVHAR